MKTAATQLLLCTVAVVTSSHCSAYVVVPSSFGIARNAITGKKVYSKIGTRTATPRIYSVPYLPGLEEDGDDGSFFLSASQQAANDRYELLKQGKDPLAISLSTASVEEERQKEQKQDVAEKEEVAVVKDVSSDGTDNNADDTPSLTLEKDDYNDLLSSLSESPMAQSLEEKKEDTPTDSSTSILDEIKRVEDEIAEVKSQMKEKMNARVADSAKQVGEGSTAEEMEAARNARLAAAGQVVAELEEGGGEEEEAAVTTSADSASEVRVGEGSTAEEIETARKARLAVADEIAKTLKETESSAVTTPTLQSEEEENEEIKTDPVVDTVPAPSATKNEEDSFNENQPKLSSDGKVLYEPSQAQLDINQENVENVRVILTRSFLVLNSIVQRLDEGKK
eukprot:scaffold652_cov142-Skeletonema_menzelii.AAC.2